MSEENTKPEAASQEQPQQQFAMQRVFMKDMSFETPMGAEAFKQEWKPAISQELNTKTAKLDDENYEVVLTITITVKLGDSPAYVAEVQQAGIFRIVGMADQQLGQVLNTVCPNILFPYAREAIDNMAVKGSFPALMLPPVNFDALFAQAVEQAKQKQAAEQASTETVN